MTAKLFAPAILAALLLASSAPAEAQISPSMERWSPVGPEGGTITALAVAPNRRDTVYAGTKEGLIFRSTDAGAHWTLAETPRAALGIVSPSPIESLQVDPRDSAVVYAAFCYALAEPLVVVGGVFRSADGGTTWAQVASNLIDCQVLDVTLDPHDPDALFVATATGLYEVANNTESWTYYEDAGSFLKVVKADPFTAGTLFVIDRDNGVLKSTDRGATWAPSNAGLPAAGSLLGLEIDAVTPDTLFVTASPGGASAVAPVYRSIDGGETWAPAAQGLGGRRVDDLAAGASLYAATAHGVFRSQDGGLTWTAPPPAQSRATLLVAAPPSPDDPVYAGTRLLGVFKSTDSGALWSAANRGLTGLAVATFAIAPSNPAVLYAVIRDLGLQRSDDGGVTWRPADTGLPLVPYTVAVDPRDPRTVYASQLGGLWRSTDGGARWQLATGPQAACTVPHTLVFDPRNRSNVYTVNYSIFCPQAPPCPGLKSTDGGRSWTCMALPDDSYTSLALDPTNSAVLFAGGHPQGAATSDAGLHWVQAGQGLPGTAGITSLVWTPTPKVLYAGTAQGLFRRAGNSATWTPANAPFTYVVELAAAPSDPTVLYARAAPMGLPAQLYRSFDAGATWRPAPQQGLPGGLHDLLIPHPSDARVLYVLTRAGIYRLGQTGRL